MRKFTDVSYIYVNNLSTMGGGIAYEDVIISYIMLTFGL